MSASLRAYLREMDQASSLTKASGSYEVRHVHKIRKAEDVLSITFSHVFFSARRFLAALDLPSRSQTAYEMIVSGAACVCSTSSGSCSSRTATRKVRFLL